ncbi:hypothetical protein PORY_002279 [Pneumocystis oryctolagi]|uniref:Uncharacterized protein n=1 Tax=Pneumocystis oryctolagi TaxID=42067 RepID=A0ACB7CBV5_9ASCO|nr:hypothetical protein PORY_002279 [Pneumocystis oryctolagi]
MESLIQNETTNVSNSANTFSNMDNSHKLKKLCTEYTPIMDYITQCCSILTDSAVLNEDLIIPEESSNSSEISKLEDALKSLIDSMTYIKFQEDTLSEIFEKYEKKDSNLELKFQELYEEKKKKYDSLSSLQKYSKRNEYIDFKQRIWDVHHQNIPMLPTESFFQEDDDIVISYLNQNIKCPLTMKYLEEPVKSCICGHYFSKYAILEILKCNNGKCTCPVVGCNKIIDNNVLIPDKIMERRVNITKELKGDLEESEEAKKKYTYINL